MPIISRKTEKFFSDFPKLTFARGQMIVSPGDKSTSIYYLKKGFVKQFVQSAKGEKLIIHQYRPGSFFHLKWLTSAAPNDYYFQATTPVVVFCAPVKTVKTMLLANPDLLWETTRRLITGLDGLAKRLEVITVNSASFRISSLLSYLKEKYGNPIPYRLTHAEIASWVGTARETASLEMEKLQEAGKIKKNKRFIELQKN